MSEEHFPIERLSDDDGIPAELREVVQLYRVQPIPRPTYDDTSQLLTRLIMEETAVALATPNSHKFIRSTLHIASWRLRFLGPWFWTASVCLLLLGIAAAPLLQRERAVSLLIFCLPLTAILSVAHALRTLSSGLREVEISCPTSFVEVTAGCALAIVSFDCLIGLLATVGLALAHWAPFDALVVTWLGPMLLLVSISVPVALRWGTLPAIVIGGGPWLLLTGVAFVAGSTKTYSLVKLLPDNYVGGTLYTLASSVGVLILMFLLLRGSLWRRPLLS